MIKHLECMDDQKVQKTLRSGFVHATPRHSVNKCLRMKLRCGLLKNYLCELGQLY